VGCVTYELLTGKTLFQKIQSSSGVATDVERLLQQYALTGETLNKDLVERSPVKSLFFNDEGNYVQAQTNPHPSKTIKERLIKHSDLSETEVDAAADFFQACLRLNVQPR